MTKIRILFYNNAHIGDIFFSQPYIKNIVDSNQDTFDYYTYCECNYFILTSLLPNVKKIKEYPEIYNILQSYNFCPGEQLYHYDRINNILLLNTWWTSFKRLPSVTIPNICDLVAYFHFYKLIIDRVNIEYNLSINFRPLRNEYPKSVSQRLILPEYPKINIQTFLNYKTIQNNNNKKVVFYYNVLAISGQPFPVNNHEEHLHIIKELQRKDIILFLPYKIDIIVNYIFENKITNIIFADDMFNLTFDEDCENIYYYAKIAQHCDTSFYFDTGRCFLYVNNEFIENNNNIHNCKRYHIANDRYHYDLFNKFYEKPYSDLIGCNNYTNVIHFIRNI